MKKRYILCLIIMIWPLPTLAQSSDTVNSSDIWHAWGGKLSMEFNQSILKDHGFALYHDQKYLTAESISFELESQSRLAIQAPGSAFDGYLEGGLTATSSMSLTANGNTISLDKLSIIPNSKDKLTLDVLNEQGEVVFHLSHIHSKVDQRTWLLTLNHIDINLTDYAARKLGMERFSGLSIGSAYMTTNLDIPNVVLNKGIPANCVAANAQWDDGVNFLTDVALINMSIVQQVSSIGKRIGVAPSATLQNIGSADVPWYPKFTTLPGGVFPQPYGEDQHPFLIWNMYRLIDGQLEQLGGSGLKHAFFTVNSGCSCPGSNILWSDNSPVNSGACIDTYGINSNNSDSAVGIREEVNAVEATFDQCGSIFAPNGTPPGPCAEENISIPFSTLERRLYVDNGDFVTPNAEYFFEAWYLIRDDINIYNSMGFRQVIPTGSGSSWTFPPAGAFQQGPVVNNWVDPDNPGPMASNQTISNDLGHVQVISQVIDLGGGNYRYIYGIMNQDYSTGLSELRIPISTPPSASDFDDTDYLNGNNWDLAVTASEAVWTPPTVDDFQPWGTLFVFVLESSDPPQLSEVEITDNNDTSYTVIAMAPKFVAMFEDEFESP